MGSAKVAGIALAASLAAAGSGAGAAAGATVAIERDADGRRVAVFHDTPGAVRVAPTADAGIVGVGSLSPITAKHPCESGDPETIGWRPPWVTNIYHQLKPTSVAHCPSEGVDYLLLELGDGDDVANRGWREAPVLIRGGDGADTIAAPATLAELNPMYVPDGVRDASFGDYRLEGGPGDDHLSGGRGEGEVAGGDGNDWLGVGGGVSLADGGAGNDYLYTNDSLPDFVECGPGDDFAEGDWSDTFTGCERVHRPAVMGLDSNGRFVVFLTGDEQPGDEQPEDASGPVVHVAVPGRSLARLRRRGLTLDVTCSEACTFEATMTVSDRVARTRRLPGRTIATADSRRLRMKQRVGSRLAGARRLRTTLRVEARDASGNRTVRERRLTLTR